MNRHLFIDKTKRRAQAAWDLVVRIWFAFCVICFFLGIGAAL